VKTQKLAHQNTKMQTKTFGVQLFQDLHKKTQFEQGDVTKKLEK
jgi:hypothetical protein